MINEDGVYFRFSGSMRKFVNFCTQIKTLPEGHCGIIKVGCNCCKTYQDEFCLFCNKKIEWEEYKELLPIRVGAFKRELEKVGLSGHSIRRSCAIYVRTMIERLKGRSERVPEQIVEQIEARTKYAFCWSRGSGMYTTYAEGWYNYKLEDLVPNVTLVNFIWKEQNRWPLERMCPDKGAVTMAQRVQIREEIVTEAKKKGWIEKRTERREVRSDMMRIFENTTGIVGRNESVVNNLPRAEELLADLERAPVEKGEYQRMTKRKRRREKSRKQESGRCFGVEIQLRGFGYSMFAFSRSFSS